MKKEYHGSKEHKSYDKRVNQHVSLRIGEARAALSKMSHKKLASHIKH